ncbi:MAG TPA: ATP-binding protein [Usitatibacter sp.]|nr:ATP-binding protein [Usitatibacter sp.]
MQDVLAAVVALGTAEGRQDAARRLARAADAEECVVLVLDPAVDALVPAPGFTRTLRGGSSWRTFVSGLRGRNGRVAAKVELPLGNECEARAIVGHDVAFILLGGGPAEAALDTIESLLPLLAATLVAEARVELSASEAEQARASADRANMLAVALDSARAESSKLNAQLREEHRRKDEFLAMLCHELRNPLAPLVICIEMLRRPGVSASQASRSLEIAARQTAQLSRLVEDLLDVSRVSRGRIELRREPVSLATAVGDAVESSRALLESRRHAIRVELAQEPLFVKADVVRLAQILSNLLHNAAKYTDPGGRIDVRLARDADEAVISVSDTGIGMSEATLPHVFELFTQAPVALSRAQGGLGIGLTLVRALTELHGGSVSAASDGIGKGSRFTVRLPLATREIEAVPVPREAAHVAPKPLRMLIVDDNEDAADSLAEVARSMGHHAEVAYSGLTALQIALDGKFDLVMLDIGLPEMDGYEVARRLRHLVERATRIVAVTGYGAEEDRRRSREAGFDEHVVKPLMPEKLTELFARACARTAVAGHA